MAQKASRRVTSERGSETRQMALNEPSIVQNSITDVIARPTMPKVVSWPALPANWMIVSWMASPTSGTRLRRISVWACC